MAVIASKKATTVVNAAFLQEVKDSNAQLWSVLHQLRDLEPDANDEQLASRQLINSLGELRDCIGLQFSLEETYGYISGAPSSSDFGMQSAEKAKLQHRELYLQLHEICEQAEEAQYRGTIGRDFPIYLGAFAQFDHSFRAHEELEQELIRCGLGVSQFPA